MLQLANYAKFWLLS